jgi:hypothetical protein
MTVKRMLSKHAFCFLLGTVLIGMCSPPSSAGIFLSTDIPVAVGSSSFEERDILYYEFPDFSSFLTGEDLEIPKGVNVEAFAFSGDTVLFAVDIPTSIDGEDYTERDLISYDGDSFTKLLDGDAAGIPRGAAIDAATVLTDGSVVISLDILVYLGGSDIEARDLVRCVGYSCGLFFAGSDYGIPEGANLDGVMVITDEDGDGIPSQGGTSGDILFSLDMPTSVNGLEVTDRDIVRCGQSPCYNYFDELASQLPQNASVDAFSFLDDNCPDNDNPGQDDMDNDKVGDLCDDCTDTDNDGYGNPGFPNICGDDNCPTTPNPDQEDNYPPQGNAIGDACDCEPDFDCDGDVDAFDIDDFLTDYGRNSYVIPCESGNPCRGDFACDGDVDAFDMVTFLKILGEATT